MELDMYRQIFSAIVPLLATFAGPLLTHWFTELPQPAKYFISAVVGLIVGAMGSEFTAFPMHADAGATAGISMGIAGQRLLQMPTTPPERKEGA